MVADKQGVTAWRCYERNPSSTDLWRPRFAVLRFPAVLPARRHLCRDSRTRLATDVQRRAGTVDSLLAYRLARPRNALRLSAGGGDRLPAHRDSKLDRTVANPRPAVAHVGRGVVGGSR